MKVDEFGLVVMERDGWPADIGDSAHETARMSILDGSVPVSSFEHLITATGFLRHPTAPESAPGSGDNWREPDATSDMVLPMLMALELHPDPRAVGLAEIIRNRIRSTWQVAPGHIASPALIALAYKKLWLFRFFTWVQSLLFLIPVRWSDDNRMKGRIFKFEWTDGAAADWLNYIVSLEYLRKKSAQKYWRKIEAYYGPQPNSKWFQHLYEKAIDHAASKD